MVVDDTKNHNGNVVEDQIEAIPERTNGHHYKANGNLATEKKNLAAQEADAEAGSHPHYEFGGPIGVSAMMVGFPILMYYMWIGATYYDGKFPRPAPNQSMGEFFRSMGHLVFEGAFPHLKAWAIYWTFFIGEALLYVYLPGVSAKGKPLPHERGKQLDYHCSGLYSWYATIAIAITLHVTGLFPLYTILDEFGPLMSVAILSGVLVSIIAYISAFHRGVQHRMTGNHIYDFFMGAELNPRILGILDFKMFFEVRIPWFILFLLSLSAAARQYEQFGYVSGEVAFLVLAHWLYANACAKGEELIITTWFDLLAPNNESADRNRDMYYEKWGFMLIFWNLAGVPLSYCHCTLYLANRAPSAYHWNGYALAGLYASYLFIYWIWDTTNSQKNRFRHSEKGGYAKRKAFPQLPWSELENPKTLKADNGGTILVDGWCKFFQY